MTAGLSALSAGPSAESPAQDEKKCITIDDPLRGLFAQEQTLLSRPPKTEKKYEPDWKPPRPRGRQPIATTLFSIHSRESVPVPKGYLPPDEVLDELFRCRGFDKSHRLDPRLIETILSAAEYFKAPRVEIISAYRSPKFNDALSKKSRNVAEESRHTKGEAVDFNLPEVGVSQLSAWLWENFEGGVGAYDRDKFIHIDVGPKRRWKGK